jgi:predicted outer membrane repeat protein
MRTQKFAHFTRLVLPALLILAATLPLFALPRPARAATITVTSTANTGAGTLRQALIDAAAGDTIDFNLTYPATITVTSTLTITKNNLTISGPGVNNLTIDGGGAVRVFLMNSALSVNISNLKIANGKTTGTYSSTQAGAGFRADTTTGSGTKVFTNVWFHNNDAAYDGGAFYESSTTSSTVRFIGTTFTDNDSINGTSASWGGAILNGSAALVIANSTFHNNTAYDQGGAIRSSGANVTIYNTTISGNRVTRASGGSAGGLRLSFGGTTFNISNTIIAGNSINAGSTTAATANCSFAPTSGFAGSNNLEFGPATSDCNKTGMPFTLSDPALSTIGNYGGNGIPVMPPNMGSPAIDTGEPTICSNAIVNNIDARGLTRPFGSACDIGAVELIPLATPTPSSTPTATATPDPTATATATATMSAPVCFATALNGSNEVPPSGSLATGSAFLTVYPGLTYDFSAFVNNLSGTITASHIHNAPAGSNGPVVVDLGAGWVGTNPATRSIVGAALTGGATTLGILNAGNGYVNVHTTSFSSGEVRGQLAPVSCSATTPTATATLSASATATPTMTPPPPIPDTIGTFKDGAWSLRNSNSAGSPDITAIFGITGDLPVVGDWNNDGVDTIGLYRAGLFFLSDSNLSPAVNYNFAFGAPGDRPLAGRWDMLTTGSGIGVYRPSNGVVYLRRNPTAGFDNYYLIFGDPGDQPVAGDWDGNGYDGIGLYRTSNQKWYLVNNPANGVVYSDIDFTLGIDVHMPIAGDWDADSISTVGYFTASGVFSLHSTNATAGTDNVFPFGPMSALPVTGKWGSLLMGKPGAVIQPVHQHPVSGGSDGTD